MGTEKDKIWIHTEDLTVEFSEDPSGKFVTFVCDQIEIAIYVSSFDSFTNGVMMTNDMWYGRGKGEE